jgi:hypothetical protein
MPAPNPLKHKKFILCTVVDALTGVLATTAQLVPVIVNIHRIGSDETTHPYKIETVDDWREPLLEIQNAADMDGTHAGCTLASFHNKAVVQRAAWWWSRRENYDWAALDVFCNTYRQLDLVDAYNGPAIVTAEERYNFSLETACYNCGVDTVKPLDFFNRITEQ